MHDSHRPRIARVPASGVLPCLVALVAIAQSARADEGLWCFNAPPVAQLKADYGFMPSAAWLEHLQKSAVQIGASGSFVSKDGLLLTNHHVAYEHIQRLSTPERNLVETGFYARTRDAEPRLQGLSVQVLWEIRDVTAEVQAAGAGLEPAEAHAARRRTMTELEDKVSRETGLHAETVTLYRGALYHLYCYKRYDDVRLVWCPEAAAAYFGGDNDNFEYPRFCLDACLMRVYEHGAPVHPEHYLKVSQAGAADGELVFVAGHPGRTERQRTVRHLEFMRDVELPLRLRELCRREVQLEVFADRSAENARIGLDDLLGVRNSRKALTGVYAGLLDPQVMAAKRGAEQQLQAAIGASEAGMAARDAWDQIAAAQRAYAGFIDRHRLLNRGPRCELFNYARTLVRLADELPKPAPERLREYRDTELPDVYQDLDAERPVHPALETEALRSWFMAAAELLGGDDPLVTKLLGGEAPAARAAELVRGCHLADPKVRQQLAEGGAAAIAASDDALIHFMREIDPDARAIRKRYEDEVEGVEQDAYSRLGIARFDLFGQSTYPDATGTLRLAFGKVRGYTQEGQAIPPFTHVAGLFARAAERHDHPAFRLATSWQRHKEDLPADTPLDFVCTADIIGGNSGSPVVNRAGELVGLIFDGNIQSLVWDIAYDDQQSRAVAVDVRGLLAALRKVYDAAPLADELGG